VRMDLGLTDKTAFVLGASSGLGLAIAKCLADEKAHVVLSARKGERLDQALSAVKQRNASARAPSASSSAGRRGEAGMINTSGISPVLKANCR